MPLDADGLALGRVIALGLLPTIVRGDEGYGGRTDQPETPIL